MYVACNVYNIFLINATLDSTTLKKMNTEALSVYLQIHLSLKHSLDNKTMMNVKVCKIIRVLQKIIEKSTLLTKSLNQARDF